MNKILQGSVLDVLKTLPDESVDCIITSPPYYGLRDYGDQTKTIWGGNPECKHDWEYKERYVHRGSSKNTIHAAINAGNLKVEWKTSDAICLKCGAWYGQLGLEPTLTLFIEHMTLVTAELKRVLKKTGTLWWNHGDSYGGTSSKGDYRDPKYKNGRNGQAKSVTAGFMEKSLLLQVYRLAIRMTDEQKWILRNQIIWHKPNVMPSSAPDRFCVDFEPILFFTKSKKYWFKLQKEKATYTDSREGKGRQEYNNRNTKAGVLVNGERVKRTVWRVTTKPFKEAHFATFPQDLIEPMVLAGCPEGGLVLDPFMGAGTTAVVAKKLGRNYLGIELNPQYIEMAEKRISSVQLKMLI